MPKSVKKSVKQKPGKKGFSEEEKMRAVIRYKDCGNLSLVAREVGISRVALSSWIKEYQYLTKYDSAASQACAKAIERASEVRETFLKEHYSAISGVIKKGLDKADELIDNANTLNSVVLAIEKLAAIIRDFTPRDNDDNPATINLLQQTVNAIKKD